MSQENRAHLIHLGTYIPVICEYGSTRHASERFHSPSAEEAQQARRELIQTVTAFFGPFATMDITPRLKPTHEVVEDYREGIRLLPRRNKMNPDMPLESYLRVDTGRTIDQMREDIRFTFGEQTIATSYLNILDQYQQNFQISASEAARLAITFIDKTFPLIANTAHALREAGFDVATASQTAFRYIEEFIPDHIVRTKALVAQGSALNNAVIVDIKNDVMQDQENEHPPLEITATDAKAFIQAYHIQDKPYSPEELQAAFRMLECNPYLTESLLLFHQLYLDFSKGYLLQHPERLELTLEPFSEIFIHAPTEADPYNIIPNPKLLRSVANNWLPSIVAQYTGQLPDFSLETFNPMGLTPEHIRQGVIHARDLGVFQTTIGRFNETNDPEIVLLQDFLPQTCPAMVTFTEAGTMVLPAIYQYVSSKTT